MEQQIISISKILSPGQASTQDSRGVSWVIQLSSLLTGKSAKSTMWNPVGVEREREITLLHSRCRRVRGQGRHVSVCSSSRFAIFLHRFALSRCRFFTLGPDVVKLWPVPQRTAAVCGLNVHAAYEVCGCRSPQALILQAYSQSQWKCGGKDRSLSTVYSDRHGNDTDEHLSTRRNTLKIIRPARMRNERSQVRGK